MDEQQLRSRTVPAIRSFRICLDQPQRPTTILGVVRRVAAEQGRTRPTSPPLPPPRRFGAFA